MLKLIVAFSFLCCLFGCAGTAKMTPSDFNFSCWTGANDACQDYKSICDQYKAELAGSVNSYAECTEICESLYKSLYTVHAVDACQYTNNNAMTLCMRYCNVNYADNKPAETK